MSDWRRTTADDWHTRLTAAGLGAELVGGLARFLALLAAWQGATNLVGRVDAGGLLRDHVLESLAGARFLPERGRLVDVGSGNGFPAIPLLLARRAVTGVLLEPRERRWAFLKEAVRELGLTAEVRREHVDEHRAGPYDALTVRALAPKTWGAAAGRLVTPGGAVVFWAGAGGAGQVALAGFNAVLTSSLPDSRRGELAVWRRCST